MYQEFQHLRPLLAREENENIWLYFDDTGGWVYVVEVMNERDGWYSSSSSRHGIYESVRKDGGRVIVAIGCNSNNI